MIVVVCLPCSLVVRVMPLNASSPASTQELEQLVGTRSDFWPNRYPCPRCGANAQGMLERAADPNALALLKLQDLTPQEAFAAFNGCGFPDEQHCSMAAVQALLLEQPIRRVVGTDVRGAERIIVDHFELWDGSRVYFGSGGDGAVVYRITRPVSYTKKALAEKTP